MEMVAASKLRRFQDMMLKTKPFTQGLEELLKRLSQAKIEKTHPFIEAREEKKKALILITSDTGLCGSYNNDLIQTAKRFMAENDVKTFIGVGKSGITAFKKAGLTWKATFTDLRASRIEEVLSQLKATIENVYLQNEADSIYVVYSHFKTLSTYKAVTEKLLPLEKPKEAGEKRQDVEYIFEPSPETIFERLIPLFFEAKVRTLFLESIVSEQIARMQAMNLATKNAREMIDSLVLLRNKARQAAITKEIIEIVSGSKALKIK